MGWTSPESSKQIKLTRGKFALVDAQDYEYLSRWKWHTIYTGGAYYANRRQGKKNILMHYEVLKLHGKNFRPVRHTNGDRLDNRLSNLEPTGVILKKECQARKQSEEVRFLKAQRLKVALLISEVLEFTKVENDSELKSKLEQILQELKPPILVQGK